MRNFVKVEIASPVAIGAGSISLSPAGAPYSDPDPSGGRLVLADNLANPSQLEIITYTGFSGGVLTGVTKGQEGTGDQSWAAGALVIDAVTAEALKKLVDPWTLSADSVALTYNANGDTETATEVIDGDTKVTTINYTAEGAVSSIVITFRGIERTETLTYDTEGRVESIAVTEVAI